MATTIQLQSVIANYVDVNLSELAHRGFEAEHTEEGDAYTLKFSGDRNKITDLVSQHYAGELTGYGKLKSVRMYQESGPVWMCELRYEAHGEINSTSPPDTAYGKKSCRLSGGMLANALVQHPKYRTNWDHYLMSNGSQPVPAWWSEATSITMNNDDRSKYRWVTSESEVPSGGTWKVLKKPTMPGVRCYQSCTYWVIESARYRTASRAGQMVANKLNKIGTPSNTFGISGGNWKCDHADVHWAGRYWLAQLTWTHSANGWNTTLYDNE